MENIFNEAVCSVCNNSDSSKFKVKYHQDNYAVCECNVCSFVFIPPYYRNQISYENYKDENVAIAVRNGNNFVKIERHKLRYDLIKKYKPNGSLFDLGAGWGHFMLTGQQLGYEVYGIEISEQPFLYSKNDLKLPVDHIDFFEMKEDKTFDIITMWDVLEHIDKADPFIEKCARITSKDGYIVIQVPQIDSYFAKKYKNTWKMMSLDHVNYFSKKTITQLLNKHGYDVECIKSSFEIKLFIMYTILPLIKKLKGNKITVKTEIKSSERQQYFNTFTQKPMWKLKLYMKIHNIIYNTLSALNIGEEMIVIAKKK